MRKFLLLLVMALTMSLFSPLSVQASNEQEVYVEKFSVDNDMIEPMTVVVICPICTGTANRVITYGSWSLDSLITCSHGLSGYDNRYVRNKYTRISCPDCGHDKTTTTKEYKTVCAGL